MAITCPRCTSTNPLGAKYCFFDGYALGTTAHGGPIDPGSQAFPFPFVFPTGAQCANFDQLAVACVKDWSAARELLRAGTLDSFLGGMGRADLAQAAKEAVKSPDLDRGLDDFIARLPSQAVPGPRLQVETASVHLASTSVGTDGSFILKMRNLGSRLLYGSAQANAPWLQPGDYADTGPKLFQFAGAGQLNISVKGQHLRAGTNTLEGKLIFQTNGGNAEVVVKVDVPAEAFADGVLAGAVTPRQLAEKALKNPREAVPLFENGSVAAWYKKNGWAYPVPGPVGSGLGAVQQFFEALGLTKPPRLELRDREVKLAGAPGTSLRHVLQVSTPDNKPIFVHASSNQPWLSVGRAQVRGAVASIALEIREVPNQPGEVRSARVTITGNGNQRFDVPVSLQVAGDALVMLEVVEEPIMLEVVEAKAPTSSRSDDRTKPTSKFAGKAVAAELADAGSQKTGKRQVDHDTAVSRQKTKPVVATAASASANPFADLGPPAPGKKTGRSKRSYDDEPDEDRSSRSRRREKQTDYRQFLHLIPLGLMFVVFTGFLLVDIFGAGPRSDEPREEIAAKTPPTYKVVLGDEEALPFKAPPAEPKIEDDPDEKGTAPVKFEIKDEPPEVVGGDNIPVDPNPLVRFLRNENPQTLRNFGVVTSKAAGGKQLTFAADGSTNTTVVSIDGATQEFGNAATGKRYLRDPPKGKKTPKQPLLSDERWGVGVNPKGQGGILFREILEVVPGQQPAIVNGKPRRQLDTVLVRYIMQNNDKVPHKVGMRFMIDTLIGNNDGVPFAVPGLPGLVDRSHDFRAAREVPDFIQALEFPNLAMPGTVAHMTVKLGGSVEPPDRVSITAWQGASLNWEIPLADPNGDSALVLYWNEKELRPGDKREIGYAYGLGSVSSADPAGTLAITLAGSFEPGKDFTITAYVRHPVNKQTLTLELPDGLERLNGDKIVTAPATLSDTWVVTWKAKVLRTGEFPVRVKSSTGITQTKTISIAQAEEPTAGKFRLTFEPPFEPGKAFQVSAHVTDPQPKQTLMLHLAPGLKEVDGAETKSVPAIKGKDKESVVRWKVKLLEPGKFQVKVASSTGVTQSKTITVAKPAAASDDHFDMQLKGDFAPGKSFEVIVKVRRPVAGQTLKLDLPKGLESARDQLEKPVPSAANSSVAWPVKTLEPGKYPIKVISSTGTGIKKTLTIDPPVSSDGGDFKMDFSGTIAPGKEFRILAKVVHPAQNQKLTLVLPEGIKLLDDAAIVSVPAAAANGISAVSWNVRLEQAGKLTVRIESSTGQVKTRTISTTIF
jgi:hypothetical protein